jgi:ribokinase
LTQRRASTICIIPAILPPASHVVVVGSCNVDLMIRLTHLPGPGETVTGGTLQREFGGKGANAAVAAARLGAKVGLIAAVGQDADGRAVRDDLRKHGVRDDLLVVKPATTGLAAVLSDHRGENAIAVASGANHLLNSGDVTESLARAGTTAQTVVVVDLEITDSAVRAAAAYCREQDCRLVLDPGPARPLAAAVLAASTVLTPNRGEIEILTGGDGDPQRLLAAGVGAVVVTLGGAGLDVHRATVDGAEEAVQHLPAYSVDAVDTTGAGDAFAAALAVGLGEGMSLDQAVRFGAATGALATRAMGARAALPARSEVDALLRADPHGARH